MFHMKQLKSIEDELKRINFNLERLAISTEPKQPNKINHTETLKTKPEPSGKYPFKFLKSIKGRYKTTQILSDELKVSDQTVITYIKLARADGYIINRVSGSKGKGSLYKLKKGQIND